MMWKPNRLSTGPIAIPVRTAHAAAPNAGSTSLRRIQPRSPPSARVPTSSEYRRAATSKSSPLSDLVAGGYGLFQRAVARRLAGLRVDGHLHQVERGGPRRPRRPSVELVDDLLLGHADREHRAHLGADVSLSDHVLTGLRSDHAAKLEHVLAGLLDPLEHLLVRAEARADRLEALIHLGVQLIFGDRDAGEFRLLHDHQLFDHALQGGESQGILTGRIGRHLHPLRPHLEDLLANLAHKDGRVAHDRDDSVDELQGVDGRWHRRGRRRCDRIGWQAESGPLFRGGRVFEQVAHGAWPVFSPQRLQPGPREQIPHRLGSIVRRCLRGSRITRLLTACPLVSAGAPKLGAPKLSVIGKPAGAWVSGVSG